LVQKKGKKGNKMAATPLAVEKPEAKRVQFEKRPRNFGIGQDIQPQRDLSRRSDKWPKYKSPEVEGRPPDQAEGAPGSQPGRPPPSC
jgi:hypothetical protein